MNCWKQCLPLEPSTLHSLLPEVCGEQCCAADIEGKMLGNGPGYGHTVSS